MRERGAAPSVAQNVSAMRTVLTQLTTAVIAGLVPVISLRMAQYVLPG